MKYNPWKACIHQPDICLHPCDTCRVFKPTFFFSNQRAEIWSHDSIGCWSRSNLHWGPIDLKTCLDLAPNKRKLKLTANFAPENGWIGRWSGFLFGAIWAYFLPVQGVTTNQARPKNGVFARISTHEPDSTPTTLEPPQPPSGAGTWCITKLCL